MGLKIYLSPPVQGSKDLTYVHKSLRDNAFSPFGDFVKKLQIQFENFLKNDSGEKKAFALKSGTAALHISMILSEVKEGDFIFCQASTFIATVNPVLYQNAIPIFIDSEEKSWNMCPVLLENAIKDCINEGVKPKAILVGCNYGMPCDYDKLIQISLRYGIPLIEDSAAALGSSYKNKACGSFGHFSVFSLNSNKIITGSSGGILCVRKGSFTNRIQELISQAKSSEEIGYNYQMSNISAAIASSQFEELDSRVLKKRKIYNHYFSKLSKYNEIKFFDEPEHCFSNRWLTTVVFDTKELRDCVIEQLTNANIETRKLWEPLHLMKKFSQFKVYSNGVSEKLHLKGLCLPSGVSITLDEQNEIIEIIEKIVS